LSADPASAGSVVSRRRFLAPLALAQFICSFAGSNMNVMINDITEDLDTTVQGVQAAITLFLLIMAILMIPCSKLSDRWGRKRCFTIGLVLYGIGALLSAVSPGLGVLILGNSVLEGVGTALLIPPVYILTTLRFSDLTSRARAFGVISGLGGLGAAAGPLIGGLITTAISWRAAFIFQAAVIALIVLLSRRIADPLPPDPTRPFDGFGAVLSAVGMFCVVFGILQADSNTVLMTVLLAAGAAVLIWFFLYTVWGTAASEAELASSAPAIEQASDVAMALRNKKSPLGRSVPSFPLSARLGGLPLSRPSPATFRPPAAATKRSAAAARLERARGADHRRAQKQRARPLELRARASLRRLPRTEAPESSSRVIRAFRRSCFINYGSDSAKRSGADRWLGRAASAPAGRACTTAIRTKGTRLEQRV
jgi:MFS family permease